MKRPQTRGIVSKREEFYIFRRVPMSKQFLKSLSLSLSLSFQHYSSILHLAVAFNGFHFTKKLSQLLWQSPNMFRNGSDSIVFRSVQWTKKKEFRCWHSRAEYRSKLEKEKKTVVKCKLNAFFSFHRWTRGWSCFDRQTKRWLSLLVPGRKSSTSKGFVCLFLTRFLRLTPSLSSSRSFVIARAILFCPFWPWSVVNDSVKQNSHRSLLAISLSLAFLETNTTEKQP